MHIYPSKKLYTVLYSIIIVLILIIIAGSIIGISQKKSEKTLKSAQKDTYTYTPQKHYALYGDFGQLRASTVDSPAITIVLTPFLEYAADDTALQEELVTKKDILKKTILEWFSIQSAYRLSSEAPDYIKTGLIQALNEKLILGKIRNIYFEDFVILY
ncbi:MAG: flagellar basal body-associated FliL family protein [Treponema sp.]